MFLVFLVLVCFIFNFNSVFFIYLFIYFGMPCNWVLGLQIFCVGNGSSYV